MKQINGKIPVLMPSSLTLDELRKMAESIDCILKHDDASGMISMVPARQCVRSIEDMQPWGNPVAFLDQYIRATGEKK